MKSIVCTILETTGLFAPHKGTNWNEHDPMRFSKGKLLQGSTEMKHYSWAFPHSCFPHLCVPIVPPPPAPPVACILLCMYFDLHVFCSDSILHCCMFGIETCNLNLREVCQTFSKVILNQPLEGGNPKAQARNMKI